MPAPVIEPVTFATRAEMTDGVAWSAIENWGRQILSFVVFWALARLLGTVEFGVVAIATSFVVVLQILAQRGFATAVLQREDLQPQHLNCAFWISVGGSALGAVALWGSAGWIAHAFNEPLLTPVLRWLTPLIVLEGLMSVHVALLRRSLDFRSLAIRTTTAAAFGGVLGVGLAIAGFGVWSLVAQQIATTLGAFVVIWSRSSWRPTGLGTWTALGEIVHFGRSVAAISLVNVINTRGDIFIIGFVLGNAAAGAYMIAHRILTVLHELFTGSLNKVLVPVMSPRQRDPERVVGMLYTAIGVITALTFPIYMGLAATASELVPLVFGPQWAVSVPTLRILCFLGVAQTLGALHSSTLIAMGRPDRVLRVTTLSAALNLVGFLVAARFGIAFVALAYTIRAFLVMPIEFRMLESVVPLTWQRWNAAMRGPLVAAGVMALIVLGARAVLVNTLGPAATLGVVIVLGALSYLVTLRVLDPSLMREFFRQLAHFRRSDDVQGREPASPS